MCDYKVDAQAPISAPAADPAPSSATEDEETAKRRARAERFGIAFVEKPITQSKGKGARGVNDSEKNSTIKIASAVAAEVWPAKRSGVHSDIYTRLGP